jgi:hypothetical protein
MLIILPASDQTPQNVSVIFIDQRLKLHPIVQ